MKILETPRDALQGLPYLIPTCKKLELMNALLKVGFDILDIGSFVSDKAIPQLADTEEILKQIDPSEAGTKLMVLIANIQGAMKASNHEKIDYLAFPFSTSPTFLKKNINAGFDEGWKMIGEIQEICLINNKKLFVYLTMAFGNPYGDPLDIEIIHEFTDKLYTLGIKYISLSDIIGIATPQMIAEVYALLTEVYPDVEFGIHLHIKHNHWREKIEMAFQHGCEIFDGVINGLGGCPMTGYELLGNLPTTNIIEFAQSTGVALPINISQFHRAKLLVNKILSNNTYIN